MKMYIYQDKHILQFLTEPFPQYYACWSYAKYSTLRIIIPVKGILPDKTDEKLPIYEKMLPDNRFIVRKTKKGNILLEKGEDNTKRVLGLFIIEGRYKGWAEVEEEHTTAKILIESRISERKKTLMGVVALISPVERIVFHVWGHGDNFYKVFENKEGEIKKTRYSQKSWELLHENTEEGEIL
jgi:hypothetical protein